MAPLMHFECILLFDCFLVPRAMATRVSFTRERRALSLFSLSLPTHEKLRREPLTFLCTLAATRTYSTRERVPTGKSTVVVP